MSQSGLHFLGDAEPFNGRPYKEVRTSASREHEIVPFAQTVTQFQCDSAPKNGMLLRDSCERWFRDAADYALLRGNHCGRAPRTWIDYGHLADVLIGAATGDLTATYAHQNFTGDDDQKVVVGGSLFDYLDARLHLFKGHHIDQGDSEFHRSLNQLLIQQRVNQSPFAAVALKALDQFGMLSVVRNVGTASPTVLAL